MHFGIPQQCYSRFLINWCCKFSKKRPKRHYCHFKHWLHPLKGKDRNKKISFFCFILLFWLWLSPDWLYKLILILFLIFHPSILRIFPIKSCQIGENHLSLYPHILNQKLACKIPKNQYFFSENGSKQSYYPVFTYIYSKISLFTKIVG